MKTITKLLLALAALTMTLPAVGQLRMPNFGDSNDSNEQPPMQSSPDSFRLPSYGSQDNSNDKPYSDKRDSQRDGLGRSPTDNQDQPHSSYGESPATGTRSKDNSSFRAYPRLH
jgi:hypothetical protein